MKKRIIKIGSVLFILFLIGFGLLVFLSYLPARPTGPCAEGHDYVHDHTVPPTCTEEEQVWLRCTRCEDESWSHTPGSALGHNVVEYRCTVCDYEELPETVRQRLLLFTLTENRDGYTVKIDGGKAVGRVEIPETLYKVPIVEIEEKGFMGQGSITEITIPDGIVTIGNSAFEGCTGLTSVTFGKGVKTVGERAFHGCTALIEVVMGKSVNHIGAAAFGGCGKLQKMVLPFVGGKGEYFNLGSAHPKYGTTYVLGYIFGQKNYSGAQKVIACHDHDPWGGEITSAFYIPSSLASVEILEGNFISGNNYGSLVRGAFDGCSMLKEIILPADLAGAGEYVFRGCTGLERLIAPGLSITTYLMNSIGSITELEARNYPATLMPNVKRLTLHGITDTHNFTNTEIYDNLTDFTLCFASDVKKIKLENLAPILGKVTGLVLSSAKTTVEEGVLPVLTSLKRVALPHDMLADIDMQHLEELHILSDGAYAVSETLLAAVPNLKSLTLDARITGFAEGAFENCPLLSRVVLDGTSEELAREDLLARWLSLSFGGVRSNPLTHGAGLYFETSGGVEPIGAVTLPADLTALGAYVFDGCNNMTALTFDSHITAIGKDAFAGTVALETVNFGGTLAEWFGIAFEGAEANPVNGAENLIIGGEKLTELKGDLGVTALGAYTFCGYRGLTKVTLPSGITKIGTQAFSGCTALLELLLPESMIRIEAHAFEGCTSLTSVIFAELAEWSCFVVGTTEGGTLMDSDTVKNPILVAEYLGGIFADCVWEKMG